MIRGSCHCGAVVVEADLRPATVTSCNCSICRRTAGLWAYYTRKQARLVAGHEATDAYIWNDRVIELYHCRHCGCITHYESNEKNPESRFAINVRCCLELEELASLRVRHFDGADTWKYLD